MKIFLLLLLSGLGLCAQCQDVTGIWRGNFRRTNTAANSKLMELLGGEERYKFEIQLDQRSKNFSGVTYSYLTTVFYGKANCKGTVNPKTRQVMLEETKITEVRMAGSSTACVMTLFLTYSKEGDEEFMEGTYISFNTKDSSNCGKGSVFLRKVTTSDFYEEPFLAERKVKKPTTPAQKPVIKKPDSLAIAKTNTAPKTTPPVSKPATPKANSTASKTPVQKPVTTTKPPVNKPPVTNPKNDVKVVQVDTVKKDPPKIKMPDNIVVPKVLASRENEVAKTIITDATEITIDIYDNGTIDNDTISVYLDKKLVLSRQRLTDKPIKMKVNLDDDNNYHELIMTADNLGEIPPNTSLMIVRAGTKEFEVRITSNEKKNAVIVFKYQK